jgi:tryptophan synthase alpha chain
MQTSSAHRSIGQTFDNLRSAKRIGLVAFIPAGFPDLQTTAACLGALEAGGASVIEIGIPFSDPIADGPIIQEAFTAALASKIKVTDVFAMLRSVRPALKIPVVAMVSFSVVFRYGVEKFTAEAKAAGFDGLILPDLPPPEAQKVCGNVQAGGLDTILLVAPTTAPQRRKEIADLSSGFVYYLSVAGITGERDQLPADLAANVRELRTLSNRPVCVGFGIHKPRHLTQLKGLADGAIVGTAYVRRMKEHAHEGPQRIAQIVEQYSKELLSESAD